ncbi:IMP dehydrogenase [Micrococcus flavus]|uniref:Threonine dehydrogenase-like Zn-dependent dehydrogenase n=2 Tax=Micrococcus flavus TaxID=384602 RepID=A0A4Y8WZH5_9MICC|nr:zinc-binding dehydrogenase [Micrococcus flavus]MBB4883861.1 threonine dehydrogenase-like Zn-dependent dehydrogenase [Micrococcus flavus]TFI00117.1 IMP dehydrogenase [Micrococcus flavus]GGK52032.1 IMP dehydrogenase [Micrococcus flavus]
MTSENPTPTAPEIPATMKAVTMRAPGDVVVETVETPRVVKPTDVVLKLAAACVCGSDLWPYRGHNEVDHRRMGHEYVGTIVEKGAEVATLEVGDFVIGSFMLSDNTCEICQAGYQSRCVNAGEYTGSQAQYMRVELADGSLVKVPGGEPSDPERLADYLAASDVLGTGWYAAVAAQAGPGKTIAVVGDGAVGLCAVLAAKTLGAEQVIAFSRHADRAALAREFGADVVIAERGEEGAAQVRELTNGYGAHGVVEAVGTQESMDQALASVRPGGHVGFVGVSHDQTLDGSDLFGRQIHLEGGPAPVRRFLPELIERIQAGEIQPGRVFTARMPIDDAAEAYRAMDERREIKVLLEV